MCVCERERKGEIKRVTELPVETGWFGGLRLVICCNFNGFSSP